MKEWDKVVFGTSAPAPLPAFVPTPSSSPYVRKFTKDNKKGNDSPTSSPTGSPFAGKGQKWRSGSRFEKKENTASPGKEKYKNSRYGGEEGGNAETNGHSAKPNGHTTSPSKYGSSYVSNNNGMPRYKAVLLCGPPGLGKTTLAHVLARHAGYNPVEINARYHFPLFLPSHFSFLSLSPLFSPLFSLFFSSNYLILATTEKQMFSNPACTQRSRCKACSGIKNRTA